MSQDSQVNTSQDAIIIIDMNKLPEEIREKFPKDLQDKLIELMKIGKQTKIDETKPSGFFAIQQGYVAGNIYRDDILQEEKPLQKTKIQITDKQTTDEK